MIQVMTKLADNLAPGEKVLYEGRLHNIIFTKTAIMLGLFVAFAVAVKAMSQFGVFDSLESRAPVIAGHQVPIYTLIWCAPFIFAIIGVCSYLAALVKLKTSLFTVTNRRVVVSIGAMSTFSVEMMNDKVETVDVYQSFYGRMFDYGVIVLIGVGGTREPFAPLSEPHKFRSAVQQAAQHARNQRQTVN